MEEELVYTDFYTALKATLDGKRITKGEWNTDNSYGLMDDGILSLHKNGESEKTLHPWILNDGDINGEDWMILWCNLRLPLLA